MKLSVKMILRGLSVRGLGVRRLGAALSCAFAAMLSPVQAQAQAPATTAPIAVTPAAGAANINITPRRVIFSRAKRSEAVYVFNQGNAAVTVDVALVDNVMLASGEIVPLSRVAEKGPAAVAAAATIRSAKELLLAAPSRLVLGPGQGRTVRVRANLPENADGTEYRSHLTVTTVPGRDMGMTAEQAAAAERGELVLRIQSIFGISIPLIVRNGDNDVKAAIGTVTQGEAGGNAVINVPIRRAGTSSVYGNVEAKVGKEVVGLVRGLAVYPEITERTAHVPLIRALRKGEAVTVSYIGDDSKPGTALATGSFIAR